MDESSNTSYAEKYWANCLITVGSVVVISDNPGCEIRYSSIDADERVLGVVSVSDKTHPQIALRGRAAVKVTGEINRGDMLVTSDILGTARKATWIEITFKARAVFAKSLTRSNSGWAEAVIL